MKKYWYRLLSTVGLFDFCPAYKGPGTLRGVGVDYNWTGVDWRKGWRTLAKYGCNATSIELFMWSTTYDVRQGLNPLKAPYRKLLAEARAHGGTVFVSVCNDNQGSGKYGDQAPPWSKLNALATEAIQWLATLGPEGQIIQPVSETQSAWGSSFERWAITFLNQHGFDTVWNHASRPTEPGAGSDRNAYHPFKVNDVGTPCDIIVTDTGTILNALVHGGIYGGDFKDDAIYDYARRVKIAGQRDLLIYAFTGVKALDAGACKAVGAAWA